MSKLSVTLVQADLIWEDKGANRNMLAEQIRGVSGNTHLVVLPEMFSTGFTMNASALAEGMEGETVRWMRDLSSERRIVLTGSMIVRDGDQYYNRLVWMLPNGQAGYYDKRHCFSYAGEDQVFTPGDKRFIGSVNGWKVHCCICYDLRFPVWSRQQRARGVDSGGPEYDVLVYVANWPHKRVNAWTTLLRARAMENLCYVVGVNRVGTDGNGHYYSGHSMVVDPVGDILYEKAEEEDVFTVELDKNHLQSVRERFRFLDDGDDFMIV